jgi:hypothetical protein
MRRPVSLALLLLALATAAVAQLHSANAQDRDERLGMYLRTGRYAEAIRLIDEILRTRPSDDLRNVRALFDGSPNMRVRHRAGRFPCEVKDDGVLLPLTVNGTAVTWAVDTGANVTMISDAEATRLGLVIRRSVGRLQDLAGGDAVARTAIARRVVIGQTELSDVTFVILPASQMPWKELLPGRQGILGLPVAIALDALRWGRAGKKRGSAGTVRVREIGGAHDRETNVFSKPVGDSRHHGLLGMDVLSQADNVTINFQSMTLTLH